MAYVDETESSLERLFKDKPDSVANIPCFNAENYENLRKKLGEEYDISEPNVDDFYMVTVRRRA